MREQRAWAAAMLFAVGAVAQSSCAVPLSDRVVEVTNRCEADSDCGDLGRCVETTCVTTVADLADVIIEVEVPSGARFGASTTHVVSPGQPEELDLSGTSPAGYFSFYDIHLSELVELNISLKVENLPFACQGLADDDGIVPIRVELTQTRASFGLLPPGVATRVYDATTPENAPTNDVDIDVPKGAYDLYITPTLPEPPVEGPDPFAECILPPRLISDRDISDGEVHDTVVYDEAKPGEDGSVAGFDLQSWTVALIENKRGRLVSDVVQLSLSSPDVPAPWRLRYWSENGEPKEGGIVLRLTPPAELAATGGMPVFYWGLDALTENKATVASLTGVEPIEVSGAILDEGYNFSVPSTITIHSDSIDIDFGANVIYRRSIQTDPEGVFSGFKLLPGSYTFVIEPAQGNDLAVTKRTFNLTKGSQGSGQTLTVQRKLALNGSAVTVQGAAAAQINAVLEPTLPESGTFLQNVQSTLPIPPSSAATVTNSSGQFSLLVDRGTFNFSLRPEPNSGLPWAVVSRYFIDPAQESLTDIALEIPNPVLLLGEVRSTPASFTIGNARIRAWLVPKQIDPDDTTGRPSAIQIAETTSEENGGFRLLLPGSLATISQ